VYVEWKSVELAGTQLRRKPRDAGGVADAVEGARRDDIEAIADEELVLLTGANSSPATQNTTSEGDEGAEVSTERDYEGEGLNVEGEEGEEEFEELSGFWHMM
jgi:hypothetical protein